MRNVLHTSLSSLFYPTLTCAGLTTLILYIALASPAEPFSKQIVKHNETINYSIGVSVIIILFPAAVIFKLGLHLLEPLYKTCLIWKAQYKFYLV